MRPSRRADLPLRPNRRSDLRVRSDAVYNEYIEDKQAIGMIVNISERGLRVQRLLRPGARPKSKIQLEFELPGTGEVIWAQGESCFDVLWVPALRNGGQGPNATFHTSGIYVDVAADKHLRLLRDYVIERRRANLQRAIGRPPDEVVDSCAFWRLERQV